MGNIVGAALGAAVGGPVGFIVGGSVGMVTEVSGNGIIVGSTSTTTEREARQVQLPERGTTEVTVNMLRGSYTEAGIAQLAIPDEVKELLRVALGARTMTEMVQEICIQTDVAVLEKYVLRTRSRDGRVVEAAVLHARATAPVSPGTEVLTTRAEETRVFGTIVSSVRVNTESRARGFSETEAQRIGQLLQQFLVESDVYRQEMQRHGFHV